MTRLLAAAVAVAVAVSAARADLADGNYRFSQKAPAVELPMMLIKVEKKDDKPTASVIDKNNPKAPYEVSDLKVDGSTVTMTVNLGRKFTFEGMVDPKDPGVVRGCFYDDTLTIRAMLTKQEKDTIEQPAAAPKPPEPIAEAQKLQRAVFQLQNQARQSKDANEKADLTAKIKEAQKEADEKTPALYRDVLAKHADSPFAVQAANTLIQSASKAKATPAEVAGWVKIVEADAALYGPRVALDTAVQVGTLIVGQKDVAAAALPLAEKAEKSLKPTDALAAQSKVLKLLLAAQKAAGKTDAAIEARLAKIETALDDEYKAKVPPFKPEKYAGRKDKAANRVAVMELFTGAQCPPCVAADVAFDALEKAYDEKDLILIQYHMHIPGPDPLTNPSSVARWDYYREKFGQQIGGTPTTLFNGKPAAGGGGGMPQSQGKFTQYSKLIDPILEEKTDLKVGGSVKASGDKVMASVELDGVAEPGETVRLHVLLVEESIKYVGGNGLRFHHQVVRALPGGADGTKVTEKAMKKDVTIDLGEVKAGLTKYLTDFAANERPFPNADRPMDLKHLKVIALVQNHETREILNAVQMDVK